MAALIDFHTHFFSRTFFRSLAEKSPFGEDPEAVMERVARGAGIELPPEDDDTHLRRWIDALDRHGVARAVSFASVPEEIPVLARLAGSTQDRLIPFAVVEPRREGAAEDLEARLNRDGFRGAVFFPALDRRPIDDPVYEPFLRILDRCGSVAVVHCGLFRVPLRDRFGLPRAYDIQSGDPLRLAPIADRYCDVRFVIPHFGAGFLRETLMLGAVTDNVWVDSSSSNAWMNVQAVPLELGDVFERTLRVFGVERILFGTDSSVFPRGWRHDVFLAQREALGACGLSASEKERVFRQNAEEVLGLRAAATSAGVLSHP